MRGPGAQFVVVLIVAPERVDSLFDLRQMSLHLNRDAPGRHSPGSRHGDLQHSTVITGVHVVRTHPFRQGKGPLKLAGAHLSRKEVPILAPLSGLTLTLDNELVAHDEDLDTSRVNAGEGNLEDEFVPLHRDFGRKLPTARPKPVEEELLPATQEATEEVVGAPLQRGPFSHRLPYLLGLSSVKADTATCERTALAAVGHRLPPAARAAQRG